MQMSYSIIEMKLLPKNLNNRFDLSTEKISYFDNDWYRLCIIKTTKIRVAIFP